VDFLSLFCILSDQKIKYWFFPLRQSNMKTWAQLFLFATLISLSATSALAQDAGMSDDVEIIESNDAAEGEKAVYSPGEDVRYIPRVTGVAAGKDSVALQMQDFPMQQAALRATEKSNEKPAKPKDDSILTFNFLYYIIQKYKLQDIID
jgi:hypothetical protein